MKFWRAISFVIFFLLNIDLLWFIDWKMTSLRLKIYCSIFLIKSKFNRLFSFYFQSFDILFNNFLYVSPNDQKLKDRIHQTWDIMLENITKFIVAGYWLPNLPMDEKLRKRFRQKKWKYLISNQYEYHGQHLFHTQLIKSIFDILCDRLELKSTGFDYDYPSI